MFKKILSVGGWTLISRLTGFIRDVVIAAVMGVGPVADAFFVAFRIPNHFRAIFGEGAFNNAFLPTYAQVLETEGEKSAKSFASRITTLMLIVQIALLIAAFLAMPGVVRLLAPGFSDEPEKFDLAVSLTRITFPYLLLITIVTIYSAILNAHDRFWAAAAAPVLLNVAMIAALAVVFLFPNAGYAAAWGVTISGALQLVLVWWETRKVIASPRIERPRMDRPMKTFFKALGPAVIGSAGVQLAIFADTIIASFLPTGAVSSLYYADRLYQLPLGVIGIAAGTVLLPEMSRRIAAGDEAGAYAAQNRTVGLTLALAAPFLVAFLVMPDLIMSALFQRGAFSAEAAQRAGAVLAAYGLGLPAAVLIRSAVSSFYARSDTATPLIASLTAVGVNVLVKILLMDTYGVVGLALGTAIGVWVNLVLLFVLAYRRGWTAPNRSLAKTCLAIAFGSMLLAAFAWYAPAHLARWIAVLPLWHDEILLGVLGAAGALIYGGALFGSLKVLGVRLARR
ncbi:MAG TPA: murein biosynthesis integral membrane protein MurJ [Microvirga sp.]|nr:murein biosynthesis integral membrane protein MurJ [Microvirga sp.]